MMSECEKCGSDVLVVKRGRINRFTWQIEEPLGAKVINEATDDTPAELEFYDADITLHPAPHVDGRWYFIDVDKVIYVPLNEEYNLEEPTQRYVPHAAVCPATATEGTDG